MNIGYLINTHAGYLGPLNKLLSTMPLNLLEHVMIVSGGNQLTGIPRRQRYKGVPLIEVEHDSWDYTGLIELVMQANIEPFFQRHGHFFCMQDTMEFGALTHHLVSRADPEKWATAAFGGMCNLVLYRKDYLLTMSRFILEQRNATKFQSIEHEGALFKMLTQNLSRRHEGAFENSTHEITGKGTPYSEVERIREYYAGVDVVKWKANYGQNMHAMVVKP